MRDLRLPIRRGKNVERAVGSPVRKFLGFDFYSEVLGLCERNHASRGTKGERKCGLDGEGPAIFRCSSCDGGDLSGETLQRVDNARLDGRRRKRQRRVGGPREG